MSYYEHAGELQFHSKDTPTQRAFGTAYNVGLDLATQEDIFVDTGDYVEIDFGVVLEAPPGYWLMMVSRSSTFKKWGLILTNGVGVIDPSYCGPNDTVKGLFLNDSAPINIPKGTRLVQVICIPIKLATVVHHETAPVREDRGGIGSTG